MKFFAARQPILDADKNLFAYELLFRNSEDNVFPDVSDEYATSKMVESLQFDMGLDKISADHPAFINFTQSSLLQQYPKMLPKHKIVVEILETATPTKALLETIKELKDAGYCLALDDYIHKPVWQHFFPYVDIVKVDLMASTEEQVEEVKEAIKPYAHIKLLAEKVESYDEYQWALSKGFSYFQGYFFSKPEMVTSSSLNPAHQSLLELMAEVNKPEVDIDYIVELFERDVNLSFKLLRYTQSPIFRRRAKIENIRQATVLLGLEELRRFTVLLLTAQLGNEKPAELTRLSIIRARFCESLAGLADSTNKKSHSSAFLTGMLSLLNAMLDTDIKELVKELHLSDDIKKALISREGKLATYLALCESFESADWSTLDRLAVDIKQPVDVLSEKYNGAIVWAENLFNSTRS